MAAFKVTNGLDQGDPFSVICYILYNADILDIVNSKTEKGLLFIDDAAIIATGDTFETTHNTTRNIMTRNDGILNWAKIHNCEFGIDKLQLLDFSKRKIPNPIAPTKTIDMPRQTFILNEHRIKLSQTAKFLGVTLDNKLSWKPQISAAIA